MEQIEWIFIHFENNIDLLEKILQEKEIYLLEKAENVIKRLNNIYEKVIFSFFKYKSIIDFWKKLFSIFNLSTIDMRLL